MAKQQGVTVRYSISFKQKVVREIEEEGLSLATAAKRYNIKGGETVRNWVRQFGKEHLLNKVIRVEMKGEQDRIREMEKEISRLKEALADSVMANDILNTLVKVAGEHYGTDLKKNLGGQRSTGSSEAEKGTR